VQQVVVVQLPLERRNMVEKKLLGGNDSERKRIQAATNTMTARVSAQVLGMSIDGGDEGE
jgi:hypothetical protein